ncbi:phosphoglycerate dehydrogenase [Polynucleobacter sp. MWH-UH2A]|nr:phosphoglycerate dehydrogenase [Polynucleobacter sp. MWH-UH2A]
MTKVLITTVPFCELEKMPIEMLSCAGIEYVINPLGRKLREDELAELIGDFDALIAGTEKISKKVFDRAKKLKIISRVGIGLDGLDLLEAERRKIKISYTPDAPAPAVAELTVGLILSLLRSIHLANTQMHEGGWTRYFGRRISEVTIGIIGYGRIGKGVLNCLSGFSGHAGLNVLVNDINPINYHSSGGLNLVCASKEEIYAKSDVITLHVPLTSMTLNMIGRSQLLKMKPDAVLINTSRGGIVNEHDLAEVLLSGHLTGAAIDVFEHEPYEGPLSKIDNCLLTAHMGSMSVDCRARMEIEATGEVIRFFSGQPLQSVVPGFEFDFAREKING